MPVGAPGLRSTPGAAAEPRATPRVCLLVTARGLRGGRRAIRALRQAAPEAYAIPSRFRGIVLVEAAAADPLELAERVSAAAGERIGRVMAVLAEIQSEEVAIRTAALEIGLRSIGAGETFCFRLHKRGAHSIAGASQALEREIGGAIWQALRERDGRDPRVDLTSPDVTISAELLGPRTLVCLRRRAWRGPATEASG